MNLHRVLANGLHLLELGGVEDLRDGLLVLHQDRVVQPVDRHFQNLKRRESVREREKERASERVREWESGRVRE